MSPKVTFIVPLYNKMPHVFQCAESLLSQRFVDFELIFIDDASTDGSGEWISKSVHDKRITILRNERNIGPGPSRNRAIEIAKGEFIRFVDADDVILPDSTIQLVNAANAGVPLVRGNLELFDSSHPEARRLFLPVENVNSVPFWEHPSLSTPWLFTSFLFRRDLILRQPQWFPDLRKGEDPVFLARILSDAKRVRTIGDTVYLYRTRQGREERYTVKDIRDYLQHAHLVRGIFDECGHPECFVQYADNLKGAIANMLEQCELSSVEQNELEMVATTLLCNGAPSDRLRGNQSRT